MSLRRKVAFVAAGVGLIPAAVAAPAAHHRPGHAPALRATQAHPSPAPAGVEPAGPSPAAPAAVIPPSSPSTTTPASTTEAPTTSTTVAAAARTVPDRPAIAAGGTTSASWYGAESGARTADGDRYDPEGLTFAHRSMPFGTAVRFCRDGACVVATCTDRGPAAWTGRDFDLSRATFGAIAPLSAGVATVSWERLG